MNTKVLLSLRSLFVAVCTFTGGLLALSLPTGSFSYTSLIVIGFIIGCLGIFFEVTIKNASWYTCVSTLFGTIIGAVLVFLVYYMPFWNLVGNVFPKCLDLIRFACCVIPFYLSVVIALKKKEDVNKLLNNTKTVTREIHYTSKTVLDTTSLIDGRIVGICENNFLPSSLIVPNFVLQELANMSDSSDQIRSIKGQKGLATYKALTELKDISLKVEDVLLEKQEDPLNKLLTFTKMNKAKLLTTDFSIAQKAETLGLEWLNLSALTKALSPELSVGESFEVELVKKGKEESQAIGYLCDGSMVVVNEAANMIGKAVRAEVVSILPSAGGKMVFARVC